jgi:hypothetical protein
LHPPNPATAKLQERAPSHFIPLVHFVAVTPLHSPPAFTFTPNDAAATVSFQYVTPSQPHTGEDIAEITGFGVHVPPAVAQPETLQ